MTKENQRFCAVLHGCLISLFDGNFRIHCITMYLNIEGPSMDKKIADFDRFFGEISDFGGAGKDIGMEKSEIKKSTKNR